MRLAFLILCELGALVPLALTEVGAVITLVYLGTAYGAHTYISVRALVVCASVVVGLGSSMVYFFQRLWAQCFAAVVSLFWILIGFQMLHDLHANPERWGNGAGAQIAIFLIPLGAFGFACFLGMLLGKWTPDSRERGRGGALR